MAIKGILIEIEFETLTFITNALATLVTDKGELT